MLGEQAARGGGEQGDGGRCSLRCPRRAPRALRSRPRRAAVRGPLRSVGLKGTGGLGEPHRGVRVPWFAPCRLPARLGAEGARSGQGREVPMGLGVEVLGRPSIE